MSKSAASLSEKDLETLRWATRHLEHPSLAARLTSVIGTPIEIGIRLLPRPLYAKTREIADTAISKALQTAVSSLRHEVEPDPRDGLYRVLAAGSGAVGGLFGIYGLPVEFGISTTIMLRSIAEIARFQGEDIHTPEAQLSCLEVFALGGKSESDDAAETGYYGIRLALAWPVTHATHYITKHGLGADGSPLLASLVSTIGRRFNLAVTQKMAAQMVPLIGAAGAATINVIFMNHFQEMAHGHFSVRRLERKYGKELVQASYEAICREQDARSKR
ncbi:MAG: EcsC family protein [Gammaproteobacteria bacterium]|jgi:hypothetical protein